MFISEKFKLYLRAIAALLFVFSVTACSSIEPWVKPYERDHLADPIMKFERHPVSSAYIHHIYEVRESARGGLGATGGGCGCN
ncbi:MAG TPA: DUF4266 domain-containing protein [Chromatiales bacterium]|nr:DUF4266 domain-containing protein [Thiotrichales bacterium]HIP68298.1 DUF4266 domain-containing protein [Chromatiales bacterium]